MPMIEPETEPQSFLPLSAERGRPVKLAMQQLFLTGRILPVGARLMVCHKFISSELKPLEVIYSFALPRDAALRRFQVTGPDFAVHSELKPVHEAETTYEEALAGGHLGVMARAYRDGLVNLSVGNLRPDEPVTVWLEVLAGVDARDDSFRFRFPFTLAPSYHAGARSVAIGEQAGEIELPAGEFDDVLLPPFRTGEKGLHEIGFDLSIDAADTNLDIASPSHSVRVRATGRGGRVSLAAATEVPNRDLVLDVRTAEQTPAAFRGRGTDKRSHFILSIPSRVFGEEPPGSRRLVFLLDRSGSMTGAPMDQARKALGACLAALESEDQFGIVAFDDRVEKFGSQLVAANAGNRDRAANFLKAINARGGTELAQGVDTAAQVAGGQGADIFILTDGQVFGTEDILALARSRELRLHCLGIGSASQDRFLTLLARETGGLSRFVTPRERVDMTALDLFASVTRPVTKTLNVDASRLSGGNIRPDAPATVFAGSRLSVYGECDAGASGELLFQWQTPDGPGELAIPLPADAANGETLRLLRGARLITDAESHITRGMDEWASGRRRQKRVDGQLEALSREYGLASRAMSLVAVVERASDRPGEPPHTQVVPVGFPQDEEFGGVFGSAYIAGPAAMRASAQPAVLGDFITGLGASRPRVGRAVKSLFHRRVMQEATAMEPEAALPSESTEDRLVDLAALLEPDGGMPGPDLEHRLLLTALAIVAFAAAGHTAGEGPFRRHLRRMTEFLRDHLPGPLSPEGNTAIEHVLEGELADQSLDESIIDAVWKAAQEGELSTETALRYLRNSVK